MAYVFGISAALLLALVIVRVVEHRRGRDVLEQERDRLDAFVAAVKQRMLWGVANMAEFVRRDILVRGLHVLSYLALLLVRGLEHRLVRVVAFFRRIGRSGRSRGKGSVERDEE